MTASENPTGSGYGYFETIRIERHGLSHTCQLPKQLHAHPGSMLLLAPTIMKSRVIGIELIRWDSKS